MSRLRHLFDLNARPDVIAHCLARDPRLRAAVRRRPGLRVPGGFDGFEIAVRAILGQQASVRAATRFAGRLAERFGRCIETPFAGLTRLTPMVESLAAARDVELAAIGITLQRGQTLGRLARALVAGDVSLVPGAPPEETMTKLSLIQGIGDWTAQYIAMRALRWPDAFPAGDLVLRRGLGNGSEHRARLAADCWRPWRAYGAMHVWTMKSTKQEVA